MRRCVPIDRREALGLRAVVLRRDWECMGRLIMLNSDEIAVALLGIAGKHLTINRIT